MMNLIPRRLGDYEIHDAVYSGYLHRFTTDGPSDFGAHYIISGVGWLFRMECREFSKVLKSAAREHDWEHWLGELSGMSRDQSNSKFQAALARFPWLAQQYWRGVHLGSVPGTGLSWQWRYGWKDRAACERMLRNPHWSKPILKDVA